VAELVQAGEDPVQRVLVEVVVSRMSVGANDVANGCTVRSSRQMRGPSPPLEHGERETALGGPGKAPAQAGIVDRLGLLDGGSHGSSAAFSASKISTTSSVFIPARSRRGRRRRGRPSARSRRRTAAQLEVPLEVREHDPVVLLLACAQPGLVAL